MKMPSLLRKSDEDLEEFKDKLRSYRDFQRDVYIQTRNLNKAIKNHDLEYASKVIKKLANLLRDQLDSKKELRSNEI